MPGGVGEGGRFEGEQRIERARAGVFGHVEARVLEVPGIGNQPSRDPKTSWKTSPTQNTGTAAPITEPTRISHECTPRGHTAQMMPSETPSDGEEDERVDDQLERGGQIGPRSSRTGRRVCTESPKSPRARPVTYSTYCSGSGRSRPSWWRTSATCSGPACMPAARRAGSAGTIRDSMNVTVTAAQTTTSNHPILDSNRCPSAVRRSRRGERGVVGDEVDRRFRSRLPGVEEPDDVVVVERLVGDLPPLTHRLGEGGFDHVHRGEVCSSTRVEQFGHQLVERGVVGIAARASSRSRSTSGLV